MSNLFDERWLSSEKRGGRNVRTSIAVFNLADDLLAIFHHFFHLGINQFACTRGGWKHAGRYARLVVLHEHCGFGAGQFERFPKDPGRDHWHFQLMPGNGVPKLKPNISQ
jgi:hypothetical protein